MENNSHGNIFTTKKADHYVICKQDVNISLSFTKRGVDDFSLYPRNQ